jgi:septum site-determining protein MinD
VHRDHVRKDGVGKTTTTANLGVGLAMTGDRGRRGRGHRAPQLDVILGLENRIVYDLVHVVEGQCRLRQARSGQAPREPLAAPAAQTR